MIQSWSAVLCKVVKQCDTELVDSVIPGGSDIENVGLSRARGGSELGRAGFP